MTATEVPHGYKRTEVGVIPDDWDVKCLKHISPSQSVGLVINPSTYFDTAGEVPMLVGSNINENSIDWESAKRITVESNQSLPASRIYAGDLVMVRVGEPGVTSVVPLELNGCNCASMMIVRQHSRFNSQWLCYVMNSSAGRGQVEHVQYGTAQKQFNISDAIDFRYAVPPTLAEQEAIAEALGDADAQIESLEQLVAKKRHLKQAAMQQLLTGKKRLPGFEGEWKVQSLRDCLLAAPDYGINAPGVEFDGSLPAYLRITDIDDDGRLYDNNRVAVDHPSSPDYVLEQNDIVFARTGASVGKTYLYRPSDGSFVFAGFLIRARVDQTKLCPAFLFNYTHTRLYWKWVRVMSMRSGQPGINGNEYASLELPLPPTVDEQNAIAEILSDMDTEIEAIEAKLAKARQIKQGMMQELLTGRTRLV